MYSSHQPQSPGRESPTFLTIPPELRIKIYRYACEGDEILLTDYYNGDERPLVRHDHWLSTCRKVRQEATPISLAASKITVKHVSPTLDNLHSGIWATCLHKPSHRIHVKVPDRYLTTLNHVVLIDDILIVNMHLTAAFPAMRLLEIHDVSTPVWYDRQIPPSESSKNHSLEANTGIARPN